MESITLINTADLLEESAFEKPEPHWSEAFKHDRYDWSDPEFIRLNRSGRYAWRPIELTQGYFMMVSVGSYLRLTTFNGEGPKRWRVNIQRDRRGDVIAVYARRNGRRGAREVYAHREAMYATSDGGIVDHINGWQLDNRSGTAEYPVNLRDSSHRENRHNQNGERTKNHGLPVGVEFRHGKYRGIIYRRAEGKRRSIRSPEAWPTPERAARWYQAQLDELHQSRGRMHNPSSVNYPVFPPRLESEMSERSWRLRQRARAPLELEEAIPF